MDHEIGLEIQQACAHGQCQVELDNGSGATMRVQLVGYDDADIEALARGFWNAQ